MSNAPASAASIDHDAETSPSESEGASCGAPSPLAALEALGALATTACVPRRAGSSAGGRFAQETQESTATIMAALESRESPTSNVVVPARRVPHASMRTRLPTRVEPMNRAEGLRGVLYFPRTTTL